MARKGYAAASSSGASQPTAPRRAAASSSSASQPTEPIKTSQPDVPEVAEAKTAASSSGASQPTAPRRAAASSSSASQPTEPIKTSQPDVPEVAEAKTSINPKVEGLVAEVKELGHFPDRTAPAENSFYQRLLRKRKLFSEEQWENLKNIGASQPVEVRELGPLRKKADPAFLALLVICF